MGLANELLILERTKIEIFIRSSIICKLSKVKKKYANNLRVHSSKMDSLDELMIQVSDL